MQAWERVRTLYQSKDQNPTQPTHGRKKKIKQKEIKKERADHANRKTLALLLKPASPTPSNTGSLRSFQRDTDRGTKVIIIYHDSLPTPRRDSHVKSDKTHTHSHQHTPLSPYT